MKTVIVGVSGGVAYPIEVPEGVTLEIRDYDNAINGVVDDGGLTLVEIAAEGHRTDAYLEVGGVPPGEDGDGRGMG